MRKLTIESIKKHDGIAGDNEKKVIMVNNKNELGQYYDELYGDMDDDLFEVHEDVYEKINDLEVGTYKIDQGDFNLTVDIE